jgi:hypothetical protein
MDSSVSPKEEIWFQRVCRHISNTVYSEKGVKLNIRPDPSDFKMSGAAPPVLHKLSLHKQRQL